MKFNVISTFPTFIEQAMSHGVVGQAVQRGLVELRLINPRQFTDNTHQTVDNRPFGGGDGMLMLAEPLKRALESLNDEKGHVVFLSPHGKRWCDSMARNWSVDHKKVTLICGRYGGVDQRFIEKYVHEEVSLGDFVLSGGEIASLALMDSLIRQLPGVLGNQVSSDIDSFQKGLLEAPQFTRPRKWGDLSVPEDLLSGDHKRIQLWKEVLALVKTSQLRPDLIKVSQKKHLHRARQEVLKMSDGELQACGLKRSELTHSEWMHSELDRSTMNHLHVGLVHWPVRDRTGRVVATNVTHFDIHDMARVCRSYGIGTYHIIHRLEEQRMFVSRVLDHWRVGAGVKFNPMRKTALGLVRTSSHLGEALKSFSEPPYVVATAARELEGVEKVSFRDLRNRVLRGESIFLVFGTGFGLSPAVFEECDGVLEPIWGAAPDKYRHLSVRSAASICLDRLLGTW